MPFREAGHRQVAHQKLAKGREIEAVAEQLGMSAAAVRMMLRRAGP